MTAVSEDASVDLKRRIAELERRLEAALIERDAAIDRQTASALVNFRLQSEARAGLDRQSAAAEILRTIAKAPGDAPRVLQQIAETCARLFGAPSVSIQLAENGEFTQAYRYGDSATRVREAVPLDTIRVGGPNLPGTVIAENRQIHLPDLDHLDPAFAHWPGPPHARASGTRTMCGTPLRREDKAIGVLIVYRDRLAPFTQDELALLQSFADQGAIAIENARLFNEAQEALARQTATSDMLRVISASPTDVQPVFDAIVLTAARLLGCDRCTILRTEGATFSAVAAANRDGPIDALSPPNQPIDPAANFPSQAIVARTMLHVPDWANVELPEHERVIRDMLDINSALYLPLLRGDDCIGLLVLVASRPNRFGPAEIELAESFRDQALIAIENARLFNETREALERQTATADILKVIASSPSDVQPVFDAIAESAVRLFEPCAASIVTLKDEKLHWNTTASLLPGFDVEAAKTIYPLPFDPARSPSARAILERRIIEIPDTDAPDTPEFTRRAAAAGGFRNVMFVPLVHRDEGIGVIILNHPQPGFRLSDKQLSLVQTFADQAVIAIENTRLFNETREALERQTATADILQVIAGSPSDVRPVFEAIATRANSLVGGFSATVFRFVEGVAYLEAFTPTTPEADEVLASTFPTPVANFAPFEMAQAGQVTQIADTETLTDEILDIARARGFRSMLFAPLMNKGVSIGMIAVTRLQPGAFSDHHVQILKTFSDQAVIAIENTRLFNEVQAKTADLEESLRQQTATAEVLKVISRSAFDLETVMNTLTRSAAALCGAGLGSIHLREGDQLVAKGFSLTEEKATAYIRDNPIPVDEQSYSGRAVLTGAIANIGDVTGDTTSPVLRRMSGILDYKALLLVPLMREGRGVGLFSLTRNEAGAFSQREVELVQTFADQAVIAIENVRLFNEVEAKTRDLSEALERQTATSEVLAVISRSPSDLQPVLETISDTAARLVGSEQTMFFRFDGEVFRILASWNFPPEVHEMLERRPLYPGHPSAIGRAGASLKPVCIPDVVDDPAYGLNREQNLALYRATLGVPLLREGRLIGALSLNRREPGAFTEKHIELVTTFADQAAIAIENVRLFEEVQAKTAELTEALTYQTGSARILNVIASSPTDVNPVLQAIVESASELCGADDAIVLLRDGEELRFRAHHGPIASNVETWPINRGWAAGRAVLDQKPVHLPDILADTDDEFTDSRALSDNFDGSTIRSVLSVPLLLEKESIGAITLRRAEPRAFDDKQISLLQTFADQAVIAIGNVSLFEEVQARTKDLQESLQQQTATAEVLGVIASSPSEVDPVLKAIVESASRMCEANDAYIALKDGNDLVFQAQLGAIPVGWDRRPIDRQWPSGRAAVDGRPVHVHDIHGPEGEEFPGGRDLARNDGVRTILVVPLMLEGECIGVIILRRTLVQPFSDKQIALLKTFADQAVIAIKNARLFDEVQARTRELTEALTYQTGSSNILRVIASSPTDVGPVLEAIVESACELCEAYDAVVALKDGNEVTLGAHHGPIPMNRQRWSNDRASISGRAMADQRIVHVTDVLADESGEFAIAREMSRVDGCHTLLGAPLLREGESIGAIVLRRAEVAPFSDKQISLLQTFADQAVIAIGNARLFDEVQARTRELAKSLDDLRTAQDRLIQTEKLASLGQLTAGIAHEIKNPLNFVNNFAALSAELTDELKDALKPAVLDETIRSEVNEITGLLKDNLGKVVQHGKRADSIVKNMLLHSREGSGDHRPTDVNALVDESLNLAYHGARAEKPQFNVTLQRDFDPDAGTIEAFPQEITRVLLNLITNGFYAVTKRKQSQGETPFEPMVSATTKGRSEHVEIRIRDNGTGIPAEVKEKMFNPFFTTKPAGEGTGLGLSMSHDIIVKQHGGTIDVETVPGEFTEFTVILPRSKQ